MFYLGDIALFENRFNMLILAIVGATLVLNL